MKNMTELQELKENVSRIGDSTLENFEERGYNSLEDLKNIPRDELLKIPGVGGSTANDIIKFLYEKGLRGRVSKKAENRRKLKKLLRELFQFDLADLDFGIYRIMNQKREQIEKFIEEDLIEAVEEELEEYKSRNVEELKSKLDGLGEKVRKQLGEEVLNSSGEVVEGEVPDVPFAQELIDRYKSVRQEIEEAELSEEVEAAIFSDLYNFFKRYYDKGDFVAKRRYSKENRYAIPYNGQETLFYWANRDQYYIKSGEYFNNYQFKTGEFSIQFQLKNAEVEMSTQRGEEGVFVLYDKNPINFKSEDNELCINFQYRPLDNQIEEEYGISPNSQTKKENIREEVAKRVLEKIPLPLKEKLNSSEGADDETVLEKHLKRYTTKKETDFFIHKNLKEFLERELEFYIKNEIVDADNIIDGNEKLVKKHIDRAKVVRNIAKKIIDFLSQIEEFQKRLFEKKKFVISTEYCVTLDKIPEKFYDEILENEEQVNEWKNLYNLKEAVEGSSHTSVGDFIDKDFLKQNQSLMVDTKFFSQDFKDRLLAIFDNLDKDIDGVMLHSENFQALNLILDKYRERVKCFYLDPPYNTGHEFIYKDKYKHSSWLSMISNRLNLAKKFANDEGLFFISSDDHEYPRLNLLLQKYFGESALAGPIIVQVNKGGRSYLPIAKMHEYVICASASGKAPEIYEIPKKEEYPYEDSRGNWKDRGLRNRNPKFTRENRPNLFYPIYVNPKNTDKYGNAAVSLEKSDQHSLVLYPKNSQGEDDCWRWDKDKVSKNINPQSPEKSEVVAKQKRNGEWKVVEKYRKRTTQIKSMWSESAVRTESGTIALRNLFGTSSVYDHPKPVELVKKCIRGGANGDDLIFDFFAGSGTTGQAVLELNEEDGGNRKYVLVEMGSYFDTVMKPRIQKVVFSDEWENGVPQKLGDGKSHMFKYQRLEQYEDALNNVEFSEDSAQKAVADFDDYFLRYMLDYETRESNTFLNLDELENPFRYKLKITKDGEPRTENVDLIETFNYLIGLKVRRRGFFENDGRIYRVVRGEKEEDEIIIVWRSTEDLDFETDSKFIEDEILTGDEDRVYVNGDTFIEKAKPIEKTFKQKLE